MSKKRGIKIIHNRIRCKNCGDIIESKSRHDWVCCSCFKDSGGSRDREMYEDLSETRPYTDEEVDAYNAHQELIAEQYGFSINYMEK